MKDVWTLATPWGPLPGRLAVITGAAGGLGRAMVTSLLEIGAAVLASDLDETALAALEQELCHDRLFVQTADVTSATSVTKLEAKAARLPFDLALWVNNAGINIRRPAEEFTSDDWERVYRTNVFSVHLGSQAAYRLFRKQGSEGSIVNLSSVAAIGVMPGRGLYGPTKSAVVQLTRQQAKEWGPAGIRVNSIAPGFVLTPISHLYNAEPAVVADAVKDIPLRRLGDPSDIARAVLMLGSGISAYQTGQDIVVDGGLTLR